jgi:uncharacterized membrane protein YccC
MLAYYLALRIGLDRPYWAMITCYVAASPQPLAGAILTKSIARVLGTVLGSGAAVMLVPNLINVPAALVLALSVWLGLCMYLAQLDRTPRSYIFVAAAFTASIVAFPVVDTPGNIFAVAVLRVQEIFIGILCASLLHGALFPRTLTRQLQMRVSQILADIERWLPQSPAAGADPLFEGTRRRLMLEVNELRGLAVQLPFDTARELPRVADVEALRDRLTALLSLDPLVRTGDAAVLLHDASVLRDRIRQPWGLAVHTDLTATQSHLSVQLSRREQVSAACVALGGAVSVALASAIWMLTAWPSGSTMAIYVGVQCAFFGAAPRGDRAVVKFLCGATAGVVAALLYAYAILPRVSDPVVLAITTAPILLVIGSVLARPATAIQGVSASVGFLSEAGFFSGYTPNFAASVNDSLALLVGVGGSVTLVSLFRLLGGGEKP